MAWGRRKVCSLLIDATANKENKMKKYFIFILAVAVVFLKAALYTFIIVYLISVGLLFSLQVKATELPKPLTCKTYSMLTGIIADARDSGLDKESAKISVYKVFLDELTYDDFNRLPKLIDTIYGTTMSSRALKDGVLEECERQVTHMKKPRHL